MAAGAIALWGFLPSESRLEPDATALMDSGTGTLTTSRGESLPLGPATSIGQGDVLTLSDGGRAFILFFEGSIAEVQGPATVTLDQSEQLVDKPALLSSYFRDAPVATEIGDSKNTLRLAVTVGDVLLAVAPGVTDFILEGPGSAAAVPAGGRVAVRAQETQPQVWEAHEGPVTLAARIVEQSGDRGIAVYPMRDGISLKLPFVGGGVPQETIEKIAQDAVAFDGRPEVRAGGRTFFALRRDGQVLAYTTSRPEAAAPPPASTGLNSRRAVRVPGTRTETITDQGLREALPDDEDLDVRILAGNRVLVEFQKLEYVVGVSVSEGRLQLAGAPFGLDLRGELEDLPPVLAIRTEQGVATVTLPVDETVEVVVPAPERSEALPRLPSVPYFESIPVPREISTDWEVLSANIVIGAWIVYAIKAVHALSNALLRRGERTLQAMLAERTAAARGLGRVWSSVVGLPGMGILLALVLVGANGLLFSYLDPDFRILGPDWAFILVSMTLVVGLVGMADAVARSLLLRRWGQGPGLTLYPVNLVLAAISVEISRGMSLAPGLVFGTPGTAQHPSDLSQDRRLKLAIAGLAVTAVIAAGGWTGGALLAEYGPSLEESNRAVSVLGPLGRVQDLLLLLFAAGVMRLFLLLVPFGIQPGAALWRRSKAAWVFVTAAVAFLFTHALVNQQGTTGDVLGDNLPVVIGLAVGSVVVGLLLLLMGRLWRPQVAA